MRPLLTLGVSCLALVGLVMLSMPTAAAHPVNLRTAAAFAILAGSGITNTGHSTVQGDVGSHPTTSQTGFGGPADLVTLVPPSVNHGGDDVTRVAKDDLMAAYLEARDRPGATFVGQLAGRTLLAGVYADDNAPDSMSNTGILTLDGAGLASSVFIFQSGSTLTFGPGSSVLLTNGAQACNVFWQVTSSATLDTTAHVEGAILALASATLNQGATVNGRVLASHGVVTLDSNTIRNVPCATGDTTSPGSTTGPSGTSDATTSGSTGPTSAGTTTTGAATTGSMSTGNTMTTSHTTTRGDTMTTSDTKTTGGTMTTTLSLPASTTGGTTPPAIPFFPTPLAFALGAIAAAVGAVLVLRRRRQ